MGRSFETPVRVRLSETNALGVVYYANYFVYLDLERLEILRIESTFRTHLRADSTGPACLSV